MDAADAASMLMDLSPDPTGVVPIQSCLVPAELPADFTRIRRRPVQSNFMPEPLADLFPVWLA